METCPIYTWKETGVILGWRTGCPDWGLLVHSEIMETVPQLGQSNPLKSYKLTINTHLQI
jgi:hypothetical protein